MRFLLSHRWLPVTTYVLFVVAVAFSQPKATGITGRVRDQLGKPIPKAQVRVFSKETLIREAYANAADEYDLSDLPAGRLTVKIWSLGFVTKRVSLKLTQGQTKQLDVVLIAGQIATLDRICANAHNKSLDASGGSVFRIMTGPAMHS